jgi:hypothetical protein
METTESPAIRLSGKRCYAFAHAKLCVKRTKQNSFMTQHLPQVNPQIVTNRKVRILGRRYLSAFIGFPVQWYFGTSASRTKQPENRRTVGP